jgi:hypothetical protein
LRAATFCTRPIVHGLRGWGTRLAVGRGVSRHPLELNVALIGPYLLSQRLRDAVSWRVDECKLID